MFGIAKSMFGRAKSKQAQGLKESDRISQLPDPLICQILSHLLTKDAVRTSVLSTRWRNLWLCVPRLSLNSRRFPDLYAFVSFGDRFFDSDRVSCIDKVELAVAENKDDMSYITPWIDAAVKRKIQHLDVQRLTGRFPFPRETCVHEMPLSLYICESLVSLKLSEVALVDAEFVSFPCLKTMHLMYVWYPNVATLERLVSCCPALEELKIFETRNDAKVLRVHSRSLKRLTYLLLSASFEFDSVLEVVIDAPLLRFLSIYDTFSNSFIVNNLESGAELVISLGFGLKHFDKESVSSRRSRTRSFLPGISRVRDMTIAADTFKVINEYSKLEPLPQFRYMSRLFVTLCVSDLECLHVFLERCPNLKSLILALKNHEEMRSEEMNQISYSYVPDCFLSSLEFVDFTMPISGYAAEMKLVKYVLENSAILKKLTLTVNYDSIGYDFFKELLKIPRCSTTCQVVVI